MAKAPVKDRNYSSSHLKTIDGAIQEVKTWPAWKRDAVVFKRNTVYRSSISGQFVKVKADK